MHGLEEIKRMNEAANKPKIVYLLITYNIFDKNKVHGIFENHKLARDARRQLKEQGELPELFVIPLDKFTEKGMVIG